MRHTNLVTFVFQVSVVSFIMRHSDVVIQTTAQDDVIVSAEVQCVDLVEHGNIGLETFQTQFATGMLR